MQQAVDIAVRGACHGGDAEQTNKRFGPRPRALRPGERSGSMRIGRGFERRVRVRSERRRQHPDDTAMLARVAVNETPKQEHKT